jgi:integrase
MRRRGLAPGTIEKRVRLARDWLEAHHDPWVATGADVERWIDAHTGWLDASTRYTAVSHLHAFYVFAIRAGFTSIDPTVTVERPRLRARLPRPIHPTDLAIALAIANPMMRVALLLAATSGLRCCELARLRWDDIHDDRARLIGKGSKHRVVPLHPLTLDALDVLDRVDVHVLAGWQSHVEAHPGLNVSRRVNAHLHALAISATAHQLRHFAGTAALRASGGDLRKVQQLLGHASPATTAIYTALDVDDLVDMVGGIEIPSISTAIRAVSEPREHPSRLTRDP